MARFLSKKSGSIVLTLLVASVLTASFQNCSEPLSFKTTQSSKAQESGGGNGDGYLGKPTIYDFHSQTSACTQLGANGSALPNDVIFVYPSLKALKVRSDCQDVTPQPIASGDISLNADSSRLTYQQMSFVRRDVVNDFSVVAAACPAGMTPLASPIRTNLMRDSQDMTGSGWANIHPGLGYALDGVIASLPRWSVSRASPPYGTTWYRPSQQINLVAGTRYAYTFAAEKRTVDGANIHIYQTGGANIHVQLDLTNGVANVQSTTGVTGFSNRVSPLGKGFVTTLYFDATTSGLADIGVVSLTANPGDSIYTTAFQLEDVRAFCQ